MKICIVIPVYNESARIGSVVAAIKQKNIDVVVIDDGSTDNSSAIARELGALVIWHDQKHGKGFTLQKGFEYALTHHYDGVVTMDGDGQHDASDLEGILNKAHQFPQAIVTGNRMGAPQDMPWVRILTNRYMSSLISLICRQDIPDSQCGFRFIPAVILKDIQLSCKDFEIESEVLIEASKRGYKIYSVGVKSIYRDEDSKINPLKDTVRFFIYLLKEFCSRSSYEQR